LTFGQYAQYKSCVKYSNLSPCKISHFSEITKHFFQLLFHLQGKSKRKMNLKIENLLGSFFAPACFYSIPRPVEVVSPQISPAPRPRGNAGEIAVVEPVTRHHLRTTVSPPMRPRPRAISSFPRACSIASALSTAPLPPSLRQLGCPRQEYNDEALKQAASLAKLPLPKACHVGRRLVLPTCAHSRIGKVR
jgi:hypothetical protein